MTRPEYTERYVEAFHTLESNSFLHDPEWTQNLRKAALSRFTDLGFPTTRRGNEEWKYTDVRPIARHPFRPVTGPPSVGIDAQAIQPFILGTQAWHRLVFVDGRYAPELSSLSRLPQGVTVLDLAEAMTAQGDLVQQHLGRTADYASQGFTALNTAFVHSGAFIHLADRASMEEPIHLLFLTSGETEDAASNPRVLIVTGQDSKVAVIESYASLTDNRHFTNAVTEIVTGPGSVVDYYKIQIQNEQTFHIGTTQVEVNRDSRFTSVSVDIGGAITRNNLTVMMAGEGAFCELDGVYVVSRSQHVDNQVIVDHVVGHNRSNELYKGILDGRSRSVFHGSVIVRKYAAKVNANQVDKNLLLSDEAEADTKPAFWIYCDDVRCGHGAACGNIDEDAMFYLMNRGIDEGTARDTLIRAFVSEVVDIVKDDSLRRYVDDVVGEKLRNL